MAHIYKLSAMKSTTKYSYKLRPGYGSDELLLDLNCNGFPDDLQNDLFEIVNQADLKLVGTDDLWMNDQLLFNFKSSNGIITITRDIWDLFFIEGANNQKYILKLDIRLSENPLFEKLIVDFSEYK